MAALKRFYCSVKLESILVDKYTYPWGSFLACKTYLGTSFEWPLKRGFTVVLNLRAFWWTSIPTLGKVFWLQKFSEEVEACCDLI